MRAIRPVEVAVPCIAASSAPNTGPVDWAVLTVTPVRTILARAGGEERAEERV